MKNAAYNLGYFCKEAKTLFRIDLLSNIFSILSIGLIFFILALVLSGWNITSYVINIIQGEAEINVYFVEGLEDREINHLLGQIESIEGIGQVRKVEEKESYERMEDILGSESHILELFDENPFTGFIEVKIDIDERTYILDELNGLDNVDYIRDNKEVIDRLQDIVFVLQFISIIVVVAVAISTILVVSHIIRQGIYNNRDEINTLKLLGAPQYFIDFPFILEGLFLALVGGIIASFMLLATIKYGYGRIETAIQFIPLPDSESLARKIILLIMSGSGILGIVGSIAGTKISIDK